VARGLRARGRRREGLFEQRQPLAHLRLELLAGGRQHHGVALAAEERDAQALFQLADAMADRAVREAELFGGLRIGSETPRGREGAQRLERGQVAHGRPREAAEDVKFPHIQVVN
jgi:cell division septum initiation protein DivIVA